MVAPPQRTALGVVVLTALASGVWASVPEGVPAGPWLLAPYMSTSVEGSNNVFYDSINNPRRTGDYITTLGAGIDAASRGHPRPCRAFS